MPLQPGVRIREFYWEARCYPERLGRVRSETRVHRVAEFRNLIALTNEGEMSFLTDVSPLLIPIIALLVPIVGIVAWATVKITRMNLLHETVRHFSSTGQPVPPELLAQITGDKQP